MSGGGTAQTTPAVGRRRHRRAIGVAGGTLQVELFRKVIHVSIAIVPTLAGVSMSLATTMLLLGIAAYVAAEYARRAGLSISIISRVTVLATRASEEGAFVLGPVTLGLGALVALQLYPEPAASIAIYALAFGDSAASVVGTAVGRLKIPFTGGKSVAGSLACCLVVFVAAFRITGQLGASTVIAVAAAGLEAAPTRDFDNLILPAGTGIVAAYLLL